MAIGKCPNCGTVVKPTSNGECPACLKPFSLPSLDEQKNDDRNKLAESHPEQEILIPIFPPQQIHRTPPPRRTDALEDASLNEFFSAPAKPIGVQEPETAHTMGKKNTHLRTSPVLKFIEIILISIPILSVVGMMTDASGTWGGVSMVWEQGILGKLAIIAGLLVGLWPGLNLTLGMFGFLRPAEYFAKNLDFLKNVCTKNLNQKSGQEKAYEILLLIFGLLLVAVALEILKQ